MPNSVVVGTLRAVLSASTAEFEQAMADASKSAKSWAKDLQSVGRQVSDIGKDLTKFITLPIAGVATASAKAAIDFESSFAGVRKTVDATTEEFAVMEQQFRDLAKQIPINVNELNRLGEAAGQLGIPKGEVVDFARVMALLGETTDLTSDMAAEAIAKIQNIFGAAGQDTEQFASTLVDLGNNSAATESQIVSMATRIAGAGNTIGLSQGEVLAFAAALSSVGLEAEAGGTAISRVFIEMASSVSEGGKRLDDFAKVAGQSTQAFAKAFNEDAAGAVEAFVNGLGRIKTGGGDLLGTLNTLGFSEIRVRDTLLRAAGAGDLLSESLKRQDAAWQSNTALSAEAEKRFETTASQMKLLWNQINDVAIQLGQALLPALKSLVQFAQSYVVPALESIVQAFTAMPEGAQTAVLAFAGLAAAIGPVLIIVGQLILASSRIVGAFAAEGVAATTLSGAYARLKAAQLGLLGTAGIIAGAAAGVALLGKEIADAAGLAEDAQKRLAASRTGLNPQEQPGAIHREEQELIKETTAQVEEMTKALVKNDGALKALPVTAEMLSRDYIKLGQSAGTIPPVLTDTSKAAKEAEKAAKEAAQALEEIRKEMSALGIVTERDVNSSLDKFKKVLEQAEKEGVPLEKVLQKMLPQLVELAKNAEASGTKVDDLKQIISEMRVEVEKFNATPAMALPINTDPFAVLTQGAIQLDLTSQKAAHDAEALAQAYKDLGITTQKELNEAIQVARDAYATLLRSGLATKEELAAAAQRLADAEEAAAHHTEISWLRVFDELASAFDHISRSGHGAFSSIAASAADSLRTFRALSGELSNTQRGMIAFSSALDTYQAAREHQRVASVGSGARTGAAIGSFFGPVGTGVGAGIGALVGFFASRGGGRDAVEEFADAFGGFDQLHEQLLTLGDEGERLWVNLTQGVGRSNPGQAQAAIDQITSALDRQRQSQQQLQQNFSDLFGAVEMFAGRIPASLRPIAEEILSMGGLSAEMQMMLSDLIQAPQWQELQSIAEKYGISLSALGDQFQQARITDIALEYTRDMQTLADAGADVGGVLVGMQDELSTLVQEAIKTGSALPETMRPFLVHLAQMGLLVDENGQKLSELDVAQLTFEEVEDEPLQMIASILEQIRDLLMNGLPAAAQAAADGMNAAFSSVEPPKFDVPVEYRATADGSAPTVPQFSRPVSRITGSGLAYLEPGDIAGMPSLTPGLGAPQEMVVRMWDGRVLLEAVSAAARSGGLTQV